MKLFLLQKILSNFLNEINLEDLNTLNLLLVDLGSGFNEWLDEHLNKKIDYRLYVDQMLEIVDYLEEGFGYAFMLRSLAENLIKTGELKEVTISNTPRYAVVGYVVVDKTKLKKEQVSSFIELINEDYLMLTFRWILKKIYRASAFLACMRTYMHTSYVLRDAFASLFSFDFFS